MTQAKDKRIEEGRKLLAQYEAAKEKHGQAQEAEQTDLFVWFINNRHRLFQRIEELEEALRDRDRSFELRWKADMRAIKMWQAETGEDLTWPDHADLVVWLLGKLQAPWQPMETAPKNGTKLQVLHPDGSEEDDVYWSEERYCILGAPQGSRGPGWVSTEAGNLPIDSPIHWRRAAPLLEQKETDQDSLHVDETCKENRESFACSETGEREAAMDQLLKDDGELYDEKAKSWYSLGNALRGHIHGWFSSDEEAWDALRASFNERFPSDSGRAVYLTKELFIANSSAGYPDTPPQTHGDVERVARIIDPGAWSVMDAEKERFLRKYKGENIGYPEDQFRHKESMGKASLILSAVFGNPVGYTNENQLKYVDAGGNGLFFPDEKSGCSIALYRAHAALSAMRPVSVDSVKLKEIRGRLEKSLDDFLAAFGC